MHALISVMTEQNNAGWPTVMISVSDHETGGLALARQLDVHQYPEYLWYPDVLANASHSTFWLASQVEHGAPRTKLLEVVQSGLAITDPTEAELSVLDAHAGNPWILHLDFSDMVRLAPS